MHTVSVSAEWLCLLQADPGHRLFLVLLVSGILLAAILGFIAWAVFQSYGGPHEPPTEIPLEELARRGHDPRDSQPRIVLGFVVILVLSIAFIMVAALAIYRGYMGLDARDNQLPGPELLPGRQAPPYPRLQTDPTLEYNRFHEREEHILNSYGWVDRSRGLVHIPIQEAMRLIVRQGLPVAEGEPSHTLFYPPAHAPAKNTVPAVPIKPSVRKP